MTKVHFMPSRLNIMLYSVQISFRVYKMKNTAIFIKWWMLFWSNLGKKKLFCFPPPLTSKFWKLKKKSFYLTKVYRTLRETALLPKNYHFCTLSQNCRDLFEKWYMQYSKLSKELKNSIKLCQVVLELFI